MKVVAAVPAIGIIAGAATSLLFPGTSHIAPVALVIATVTALIAWHVARPRALLAAAVVGFAAGAALLADEAWREAWRPALRQIVPDDDPVFAVLTGVLRADAAARSGGVSLSVQSVSIGRADLLGPPEAVPVTGGVLLTVSGQLARDRIDEWRAGRTIRAPVQLRRVSHYLNPGLADEERALARRGTVLVGSVKSGALVEVLRRGTWISEAAWHVRSYARRAIAAAVGRWSPQSAAIVAAIVIGDRAGLDDGLERRLQEAGTYHVIAISGGNIAILAGLALGIFRVAGMLGRGAMLSAIAALIAYAAIVTGGPSVSRATLMAVVYFAGRALDLRGPPLNILAFIAALLVAADPLAVADPAFLLTFGATTAILLGAPPGGARPSATSGAVAILAASVAAEIALMPIGAYFFSRVTFAGLLLNFAAIPMMAVAQLAGMAALTITLVSPAAAALAGFAAHLGAQGLVRSTGLLDWLPFLTWRVAPPHWAALVIYYASVTTAYAVWRGPAYVRRTALAGAVGAAGWMLCEPDKAIARRGDGRLHVTFIDVGQGDATLVRFPRGATLLVDAGGSTAGSSFDIGDRVVGAVLRHAGIKRLDIAALTHGDADHIGGLPSIVREFRPRDIWEGIPVPRSGPLGALRASASAGRSRWTTVQTRDRVTIDGIEVVVRHPPVPDWERQEVRNDDSIALELVWRDVSIVLTGDIGREAEHAIAPQFGAAGIRALKVPHHGSLTSSSPAFLARLAPRVAVVSAGRHNPFGHPAPAVLARYEAIGAHLFRTDQDGAVEMVTDGYSLDVRTFTGRELRVR